MTAKVYVHNLYWRVTTIERHGKQLDRCTILVLYILRESQLSPSEELSS